MSDYSSTEKFLHRFYLSNYFISKASFEIEETLFGNEIKRNPVEQYVFVTGLARSGTTALMRRLYETNEYASLLYNNMPFLLMPNLWKNRKVSSLHERAHKDGIKVNGNSPEEFDEYFWKVFLKDKYIENRLKKHHIPKDVLDKYLIYISLICRSQHKRKYLSKNNNNILRIESIAEIQNNKIIVLYRNPMDHAASLLKLHRQFTSMQMQDSFIIDYFNFLGHHEFGLNHKPFMLSNAYYDDLSSYDTTSMNYWLLNWINYYNYLLENFQTYFILVSFEDLIYQSQKVFNFICSELGTNSSINAKGSQYRPPKYSKMETDNNIMDQAVAIYEQLNSKREY